MITVSNLSLRYGKRVLFDEVNLKFTEGNCYGIIGANGAGKSTFLKILSGEVDPSTGGVHIEPGKRMSVLRQDHFAFDQFTVMQAVMKGNPRLYDIKEEMEAIYAKPDFSDEDGLKVVVDRETGEHDRLETRNDALLDDLHLGTYESVTYEGYDGAEIQMWVHYPPGFDENREYPLFLLLHGGPHNAVTNRFSFRWNAQTFASWGYVTGWPNFHGSSGFGQDFADSINPDWKTKPYADTIKAAEWFADQPWIDADRMVAGGASYGGYLASIVLGKDNPFQALIIHAPVYNLYSQMAGDFPVHAERFGDFWEHDIYDEISPHTLAGNFDTPSLVIHGERDHRVTSEQGFELFRALRHRGVEARMVYFPDEDHWIEKPNNSIRWYSEVRDWVTRFAKPER